jgi:hypothetical protein
MDAASFAVTGTSAPLGAGLYEGTSALLLTGGHNATDFEIDGNTGNDWLATGSITGAGTATNGPDLQVLGSDTNVALNLESKGTANVYLDSGGLRKMLELDAVASSVDWLAVSPSATGTPGIVSLGVASGSTDTNVTTKIASKGTGTVQEAGHLEAALGDTTAPTCGTGCSSVTAGSTDVRGSLTTSSSVSSITLDFGTTWASTPVCTISDSSTATVADISTLSTSVLTISTAAAVTSIKVYWICLQ